MSKAIGAHQRVARLAALLTALLCGCSDGGDDGGPAQMLAPGSAAAGASAGGTPAPVGMNEGMAGSTAPAVPMPTAGSAADPALDPGAAAGAGSVPPPGPAPDPVMSDDVVVEPCAFEIPSGTQPRCGYLSVPENRADPAQGELELHFAIFPAKAPERRVADPVVYLEGGPGGSALSRAGELYELISPAIGDARELVLVDQRGTGLSVVHAPFSCRDDVTGAALGGGLFGTPIVVGLQACGERLRGAGVDIAAYNSKESAADFEQLRAALGYPPWNLLGISYGTFLGQVILRDHPAGVRSAVLDSTLPVGDDYTRNAANLDRALDLLFMACAANTDCASWYPDLADTFYALLMRLQTNPVSAELQLPGSNMPVAVPVPPAIFLQGIFNALYSPKLLALVPRMIVEMSDGDSQIFATIFNGVLSGQSGISDGMHYAVTCYDRVAFTTAQAMSAAIGELPELSAMYTNFLGSDAPAACDAYGAGQAAAAESMPVGGSLPTLVLGGRFDPVTAPQGGHDVADALENGHFLEFPWQSHGAVRSPCAQDVIESFIDDPALAPAADCIEGEPELTFVGPNDALPQLQIQAMVMTAPMM